MAAVPEEFDQTFEQAYRAHFPMLHRRSRRWLPADEAEDLVQEAFLRAWARHPGKAPEIPWLLTVIRNLAIDRSRRKSATPVGDMEILDTPHEDGPDAQVVALEERRAVRRAMKNLTESQRQALGLREWAGMTNQQIAESLGTTVPSVESLLLRGRRRLRGALEKVMALALWPASGLWRRLRHLPEASMAATASPAAAGVLTQTVAQLATAAAVIVAGVATGTGGGDRSDRPVRDGSDTPAVSSEADRAAAFVTRNDGHGGGAGSRTTGTGGTGGTTSSSGGEETTASEPTTDPKDRPQGEGPSIGAPQPPKEPTPDGETPTHPGEPPAEDPELPAPPLDTTTTGATL